MLRGSFHKYYFFQLVEMIFFQKEKEKKKDMVKDLPIHACADSRIMIHQAIYHRNDPNPFPILATEKRF